MASWFYPLPASCLSILDRIVQDFRRNPRPLTTIRLSDTQAAAGAEAMRPVLTALETGRGFVVIDRVPLDRFTPQEAQLLYWLIGQVLGRPFEQNIQGTLLYDVRDTGQDVRSGARFSVTNADSTFHTDNSFGQEVLDYVGLLCLNAAQSGGVNQVISAYTVYHELRDNYPEVLGTLRQPYHIDRRGGVREGEEPTSRSPIFQGDERDLTLRYLRYWIETGHAKAGQPLTADQVRAMDVLDEQLGRPALRAEFALEPGQMFFLNNRWLFHNRTAFEDHAEPERRRHLVRLWLRAKGP
jgi:alpha-ketoglutarate-dependent taurine dioxygenase